MKFLAISCLFFIAYVCGTHSQGTTQTVLHHVLEKTREAGKQHLLSNGKNGWTLTVTKYINNTGTVSEHGQICIGKLPDPHRNGDENKF